MKKPPSVLVFTIFNNIFLSLLAILCLLPFINIIAISFSNNSAVAANYVKLWPIGFNISAYRWILTREMFWNALIVSFQRVAFGGVINVLLIILTAYPLSKESSYFKPRTVYVWFFFFTMLFTGGLIPQYVLLHTLGMLNTMWSLVLPTALPIFNLILMLSFFRQIPRELEEAALVDGASPFRVLWGIYVPCSLPAIATISLFVVVFHWNSWFDGLIFMDEPSKYPMQSYLQTIIIGLRMQLQSAQTGDYALLKELSNRTVRAAQIIVGTVPVLIVYPLLQKHFVKGITLGSVKG